MCFLVMAKSFSCRTAASPEWETTLPDLGRLVGVSPLDALGSLKADGLTGKAIEKGDPKTEPPRVCRRLFSLSHATIAGSLIWA